MKHENVPVLLPFLLSSASSSRQADLLVIGHSVDPAVVVSLNRIVVVASHRISAHEVRYDLRPDFAVMVIDTIQIDDHVRFAPVVAHSPDKAASCDSFALKRV